MRMNFWNRSSVGFRTSLVGFFAVLLVANSVIAAEPVTVHAVTETESVSSTDDAADDAEIWVNPVEADKSLVIGTDKQRGLAVYNLQGKQISFAADGEMNNVDLRTGFPLGGSTIALVAASNRSDGSIAVYALDGDAGTLRSVAARPLLTGIDVYGFCLYHDPTHDQFYAFVNSKRGEVQQWHLFDDGHGKVDMKRVVQFEVGSQVEGMVADDAQSVVYIGEEKVAVWRYPLPIDVDEIIRHAVDVSVPVGHIIEDVEGLTLYLMPDGVGYLIASNQGNDEFLVYERKAPNGFLGSFRIEALDGIDGVSGTDGIAVTSAPLGGGFARGLLVVQDDEDDTGNQNFKYVSWASIAEALKLP